MMRTILIKCMKKDPMKEGCAPEVQSNWIRSADCRGGALTYMELTYYTWGSVEKKERTGAESQGSGTCVKC